MPAIDQAAATVCNRVQRHSQQRRIIVRRRYTVCYGHGGAGLRLPHAATLLWLRIRPRPATIIPALQDRVVDVARLVCCTDIDGGHGAVAQQLKKPLDLVGAQDRANPVQKDEPRRCENNMDHGQELLLAQRKQGS